MTKQNYKLSGVRKVAIDGLLLSGLIVAVVASDLVWRPFQRGFFCGDESLMYPYHTDTVTVQMLRGVGLGLPSFMFLLCEYFLLRGERARNGFYGLKISLWLQGLYRVVYAFYTGYLFVELTANIAKNIIGRPRPHFFDVCKPSIDCSAAEWRERYIQSEDYECTGPSHHLYNDMRRSFLSGHSAISAYTMIFLALYLQSRMTLSGSRSLRHVIQFVVIMLSWFTALSRISDFKHHWSDVLAGYATGSLIAVIVWCCCTELITKNPKEHLPQHEVVYTPNQQVLTTIQSS